MKQHGANKPDFSFHFVLCNASLSIDTAGFALVTEVALLNLHDFKKPAEPRLQLSGFLGFTRRVLAYTCTAGSRHVKDSSRIFSKNFST